MHTNATSVQISVAHVLVTLNAMSANQEGMVDFVRTTVQPAAETLFVQKTLDFVRKVVMMVIQWLAGTVSIVPETALVVHRCCFAQSAELGLGEIFASLIALVAIPLAANKISTVHVDVTMVTLCRY